MAEHKNLTAKQEAFAQAILQGCNNIEAYQKAYKPKTKNRARLKNKASDIANNKNVRRRTEELNEKIIEKMTKKESGRRDRLIEELEEARTVAMALERPQAGAAVQAVMAKAKLLGLDVQKVDHTSSDGSMASKPIIDASKLSDDTLKDILTAKDAIKE